MFYGSWCFLGASFFGMSRPLGDPACCRGHASRNFVHIDFHFFVKSCVLDVSLACVFQGFVHNLSDFLSYVSSNFAMASMSRVVCVVLLKLAVQPSR